MGFTTGFTGGVTLTLGLAYLSVRAHQRNRQRQSDILRANAYVLSNLADGPNSHPPPPPPTREEQAILARSNFVETAKDKWNAEIEGAVRWVQTTDWDEVRDGFEAGVSRLWGRALGETPGETAERAKVAAARTAESVKTATAKEAGHAAAAAKGIYEDAKTKSTAAAREVKTKGFAAKEDAKVKTAEAAAVTQEKLGDAAEQTKQTTAGFLQRGLQRGKEIVGKARAVVGIAEERLESAAETKILHVNEIEKALQERYEKKDYVMKKSVDEILDERYRPIEQRDNTKLRGI